MCAQILSFGIRSRHPATGGHLDHEICRCPHSVQEQLLFLTIGEIELSGAEPRVVNEHGPRCHGLMDFVAIPLVQQCVYASQSDR